MRNVCFKKSLVVGIIVLLVSIGIMPLAGSISINKYVVRTGSYGVDLFCDEPYKNVKQGDTATFVVEITNTGTLDDTYDVIAGSIEDIICKVNGVNADPFNPYEFTLMPGESTTFEVTAEVWESVPVGEWDVIVETRSQNDTEVYDELILTANVQKKIKAISDSEEDCDYPYIEAFSICLISGNYKTKTSNDEYKLILDSGYDNKTMKVEGITFYFYAAKVPMWGYDNVQVWKIEATLFFGISFNGFVFGIGMGVQVKPMPYAPS